MLRRSLTKLLSCYVSPRICYCSTSSSSASHDQDDKNVYAVLNPYIDFEERIKNDRLKKSILKRNLKVNLENVVNLWKEFKKIEEDKIKLEKSKNSIQEKIKSFSEPEKHKKEIEGLKVAGKVVRQDLKNISSALSSLEQSLLQTVVRLPNDVREELFPDDVQSFFYPEKGKSCHIDIGKRLDLVDYISPCSYFLKGEAADFELDISSHFAKALCKNEFVPFSNPDFSRNLIVEGTCVNANSLLKLSKDKRSYDLFLNGSASLYPFCSYHTKHISELVPVKYVTQGRHYELSNFEDGLYSVWQCNAVQIFIGSTEKGILEEFEKTVKLITQLYEETGLHFRIVKTSASKLELFEALRLSFQVHSPFRDKYYEVGNLSFHSDYISKRLRIYYKDGNNTSFLHLVSGTVMKVPPLLASLLEYTEGCVLPKVSKL